MKRKLRKVTSESDSLMLTIPKYIVELLQLKADDEVDVDLRGKKIIINTETKEE